MHWYWVDALCIGFGLTLGKLIFKRFVSLRKNKCSSLCTICRSTFFELVFFRISHPTFMSFCTQGLPGVAESTVSISWGNLLFWEKIPAKRMRGRRKCFCLAPSTVCDSNPLPESEDYLLGGWILRLRLRLRTEWQVRGILRRMKVFRLENPTKRKSVAMYIYLGLMLCALVLG